MSRELTRRSLVDWDAAAQIAAKVTEVLADLVLSATPEDRTALLADVIANLGHLVLEKSEEIESGSSTGEAKSRRH